MILSYKITFALFYFLPLLYVSAADTNITNFQIITNFKSVSLKEAKIVVKHRGESISLGQKVYAAETSAGDGNFFIDWSDWKKQTIFPITPNDFVSIEVDFYETGKSSSPSHHASLKLWKHPYKAIAHRVLAGGGVHVIWDHRTEELFIRGEEENKLLDGKGEGLSTVVTEELVRKVVKEELQVAVESAVQKAMKEAMEEWKKE